MTYEQGKGWYYLFKHIHDAWSANAYMSVRRIDNNVRRALIYYMAERGAIFKDGRFEQWFDLDPQTGDLAQAEIRIDPFISDESVIRKEGHLYFRAFNESNAKIFATKLLET